MNIAAVMAALRVDDVSRSAKNALVAVACRADRYTGMASVPVSRVARDLGVSYRTAWAALNELVDRGYLNVDKSPGQPSMWMLTPAMVARVPMQSVQPTYAVVAEDLCNPERGKESLEKTKERAAASLANTASGAASGKPRLALVANAAHCPTCDGTGWRVGPGGQSFPCSHG